MTATHRETIQIGLLGLGTVGSGAYALLNSNASVIERKLGVRPIVRRIAVRDLNKRRAVTVPSGLLTSNPVEVLDDPDVEIVCELIGGVSPAREYILRALRAGKHVMVAKPMAMMTREAAAFPGIRQPEETDGLQAGLECDRGAVLRGDQVNNHITSENMGFGARDQGSEPNTWALPRGKGHRAAVSDKSASR